MIITRAEQIEYAKVPFPQFTKVPVISELSEAVYKERLKNFSERIAQEGLDAAAVYGDREHFSNFEYLCGFDPRFEEALLVIHSDMRCFAILGNECFPLAQIAKIPLTALLYQPFSLPGQPMEKSNDLCACLRDAGLTRGMKVGIIDWKIFPPSCGVQFGTPSFIMDAICDIVNVGDLKNATALMIDPASGLRTTAGWEQVVAFETSACMISQGMLKAISHIKPGMTELEVGAYLNPCGLPLTSHSNISTGARTQVGLISPTSKVIEMGDRCTMCWSIRGALSCRSFYVAHSESDLPKEERNYLEEIVKPYFASIVTFYENIGIGVTGGELHEAVTRYFPQSRYHWTLNPGHLLGSEEWLCSPVWENSPIAFRSGQFVQVDFIPQPEAPYFGSNVEDGILLADEKLRREIQERAPETWERMQGRRAYMKDVLGIHLDDAVLPLHDGQAVLRPYAMNREFAMCKRR